jgi:hypothetical protein
VIGGGHYLTEGVGPCCNHISVSSELLKVLFNLGCDGRESMLLSLLQSVCRSQSPTRCHIAVLVDLCSPISEIERITLFGA